MKILLLANYGETGGTRTYVKQLISFYLRHQFELTLVSIGPDDDEDMRALCSSHHVTIHHYKDLTSGLLPSGRMPWRVFRERRLLKNYIQSLKPDLIVASVGDPGLFFGHMGLGIRSIYILHTTPESLGTSWRKFVRYLIWRSAIPDNCLFITVSKYASSQMAAIWGLRGGNRAKVIYNTSGMPIPPQKKTKSRPLRCLTVGHVNEYKNPMLWIDIASTILKKMPSLEFVWVGPGELLDECKDKVKLLDLDEQIKFVGHHYDVTEFYEKCDIYIQPSEFESLGISVLDAMRYAIPCIVSDRGGLPELVIHNRSGYVVNLDEGVKAFESRIQELVLNEQKRVQMGKSAQDLYIQKFSPQRWDEQMLAIHRDVLQLEKA